MRTWPSADWLRAWKEMGLSSWRAKSSPSPVGPDSPGSRGLERRRGAAQSMASREGWRGQVIKRDDSREESQPVVVCLRNWPKSLRAGRSQEILPRE